MLVLHAIAIEDQGGDPTLRDRDLLESAIAMPAQMFSGEYLHSDIPEMASAYAFHICKNHPFVDGNKRVALACALIFLDMNGIEIVATEDEVCDLTEGVAKGQISKAAVAVFFSNHQTSRS